MNDATDTPERYLARLPAPERAGFKTSKSGVLFTPEQPLPDALVHQILALRLAEIG